MLFFKKINFFCFGGWQESNCFPFVCLRFCLFSGISLNGSDEAPSGNEVLSKKKGSRAAYKGHSSKLGKDIAMFLDEFVPGNLLHISKLKSYKNNVAEKNEQIKRLNNEILELVQVEEFDKEINSTFLFNDKIHDLLPRIET